MSDVYKNRSVVLANTAKTTVYTVPTADVSTTGTGNNKIHSYL